MSTLVAIIIWLTSPSINAHVNEVKSQSTQQSASFPLLEYEARYLIKFLGISAGESVHRLIQRNDGLYHFESKTDPKFDWVPYKYLESTDFSWEENTIKPQNYFYDIHEGKRSKRGNVAFDWEKNILTNMALKEPWEAVIPENVQDKLTQSLRLRYDLMRNQTNLVYQVAEDDEVKTYSFRILGDEEITTPLGTFITVKVEHIHRKGHRTNTWFAKRLDYLPIKINQIRNGRVIGQGEITALKWINQDRNVSVKKASEKS